MRSCGVALVSVLAHCPTLAYPMTMRRGDDNGGMSRFPVVGVASTPPLFSHVQAHSTNCVYVMGGRHPQLLAPVCSRDPLKRLGWMYILTRIKLKTQKPDLRVIVHSSGSKCARNTTNLSWNLPPRQGAPSTLSSVLHSHGSETLIL